MALTQDEAVIVGCIVAFTVILIFGLVLWYFSYKSKLAKRRDYDKLNRSPITSDMPKQHIDIKFETSLIHQQSINQTEQQNLLTTTDNRTDNRTEQTNIIYYEAEEVNANPIEQNTKQITIDNTGIVLVNTEYKLDVAQADDEQFQIIESMNINTNANSNTSDENGYNSQPHDDYENVANVDENNNAIAIAVKTQSKSDIIAENENTFFDDELNEEKVNIELNTLNELNKQHFVEKENDTNDRTDNMDDFEVNVKEKKRNILDGGVQDRSETAMGRHKSIKKLKSAKVVKGQRRKFEEMIKQNAGNKAIDAARMEPKEINKTKCIEAESAEMEQYDDNYNFEANISDANVKKDVEEFRSVEDEYKECDEFEQIIKEENAGNPDMEQKDEEMKNNVDVQNGDSCTTKMEQNDIDAETKKYDDFEANAYVDDADEYKQELNGNGYGYDVHRDIVRAVAMDKKSTTMKLNSLLLSTTRSTKLVIGGDSNVDVLAELCEDD